MIDSIFDSPRGLASFLQTVMLVLGLLTVILVGLPLFSTERKYAQTSEAADVPKPARTLIACLAAWLIDASLFTIPALLIIGSIFLAVKGFCLDPQVTIPDLRDDLTGTPSNIVLKCFLAAMNPVWFLLFQTWFLCNSQQPPEIDPYTNMYGQILRVCIEVVFPVGLFYAYKLICTAKFGGSIGTNIVNHENECLGESFTGKSKWLMEIVSSAFLGLPHFFNVLRSSTKFARITPGKKIVTISKGRINLFFAAACLSLCLVATSQIFTYVEQIQRVDSLKTLASQRFSARNVSTLDKCMASLSLVRSFRNLPANDDRAHTLDLLEKLTARLPNSNSIQKEIQTEKEFIGNGNPFGYIRKFYYE